LTAVNLPLLRHRSGLSIAAALLLAVSFAGMAAAGTPHRAPYRAVDQDFPDPAIIAVGHHYYAYSTNSSAGNVPVATATSLYGRWQVLATDALPVLGGWASPGLTWAPDVTRRRDGRFLLYYTAHDIASGRQCIGAATSRSPAGPFTPVGTAPLVCPAADGGAIDPAAFVDSDGKRYLVYKNDGNAIGLPTYLYVQRVAADGVTLLGSPIATVRNGPVEGNLVEAPYLIHRHGRYVMFYSYGAWNNDTYTEGYATARSLAGPWTKSPTPLMTTAGFDGAVIGPGGASILHQHGHDTIVFHGVNTTPFYRAMYVDDLAWVRGRPVVP